VLLIISLFLHWQSAGPFSVTGWELFSIDDIILFAIGIAAIFLAVLELPVANVNLPFTRGRTLTTLGIVATTLVWGILLESDHLAFGIFLAGIAALGILAGGLLAERAPALGIVVGGRAAAVAQGGPAAFQQPGGYAQPGGYGQQPGGYQQQPAPAAAAASPATQQQPAATQQASPPPPDSPGQPADWYPDPQGIKRLRYWDGSQWTEHVAD
jgi:hypothetical protein